MHPREFGRAACSPGDPGQPWGLLGVRLAGRGCVGVAVVQGSVHGLESERRRGEQGAAASKGAEAAGGGGAALGQMSGWSEANAYRAGTGSRRTAERGFWRGIGRCFMYTSGCAARSQLLGWHCWRCKRHRRQHSSCLASLAPLHLHGAQPLVGIAAGLAPPPHALLQVRRKPPRCHLAPAAGARHLRRRGAGGTQAKRVLR